MISDRTKLENPYEDHLATIIDYRDLTSDTRYYKLKFVEPEVQEHTGDYKPGQFAMFSIPGVGEAPFSISSTPTRPAFLEFGIRKVGSFTDALFKKKEGDTVYIRGPYGNGFDMKSMEGKDIVIVSGGLGAVPLRSVLLYLEDKRELYNNVFFLNGARTPEDMLFKEDFLAMHAREIIETHLTVDKDPTGEWKHNVGVVTTLFEKINGRVDKDNAYALICGPPVMYKFVIKELLKMEFSKKNILMTLERRMKCGQGHCGHCAIHGVYTCLDGPVFNYWDYERMVELI
ncbi:MAG: FAD/NAD(P)-binding protein [Candidatus Heimdallarchaeum aukensis]|uniref:FAD/NAD(P)-binding protein n=1 Tax=Candidatus Heimdallarchaeum aukensis TaxID=2876573 RepID=A0A9Y1FKV3_9ARCH|nr:MAG: FAD/NAD(P)-binding protein [Candidatus Heimdallarchaeum aukensis]